MKKLFNILRMLREDYFRLFGSGRNVIDFSKTRSVKITRLDNKDI